MKKYVCYMDDGINGIDGVKLVYIVAKNKKEGITRFAKECQGKLIKIKDVSQCYRISSNRVVEGLRLAKFTEVEIQFIVDALQQDGIVYSTFGM